MSKDPLQFKGNSLNLFGYSNGDPVNLVDFNGLSPAQMRMCMDGCSGTPTDQFRAQSAISVAQAKQTDAIVGGAGLAVVAPVVLADAAVVGVGTAAINASVIVDYVGIPLVQLCAANASTCSDISTGIAVTGAEVLFDVNLGMGLGDQGSAMNTIVGGCKDLYDLGGRWRG